MCGPGVVGASDRAVVGVGTASVGLHIVGRAGADATAILSRTGAVAECMMGTR